MGVQYVARATVCGVAILLLLAGGCATTDKLSHGGFDRIRVDATTQDEVRALIGSPDNELGDLWLYHRPDDHLEVMIDFDEGGRVTRKQWIDGLGSQWQDSDDERGRPNHD
jgi:hypothetical protein